MNALDAGFGRFLGLLATLSALMALVMVAIVSADVLLRLVLGRGLAWASEMSEYGLYLMTLLVAPWLLRHGQHVKIDVFSSRIPGRAGRALEQAIDVAGAIVCLVIAWYGLGMVLDSRANGSVMMKNVVFPEWIILAPLPVVFILLAVEFVLGLLRPPKPPEEKVLL